MSELRVRNWEKWQSYRRDRGQPPWIKVHREVMRKPEWVALTDAQRGQLLSIWLLAADRDGVIPASACLLRKLCFMDDEPDLEVLIEQGFLARDATVTPIRRQRDETEAEERQRREEESSPARTVEFSELVRLYGRAGDLSAERAYREVVPSEVSHTDLVAKRKAYCEQQGERRFWIGLAKWIRKKGYEDPTHSHNPKNRPVVRAPNGTRYVT